ncbi:MAG: SNF2-related protein [Erysipelotrichales bacterium]|nr:SNF2-related protein [Erysipelotrichales bacterium]
MLSNYSFKLEYTTSTDNVSVEFYNVALKNSVEYLRVSAYFSSKALAMFSEGIDCFSENNGKYKLIISHEISIEDFEELKRGYQIKKEIFDTLLGNMNQELSSKELKNISNLAYLIARGIVEIKMAFRPTGIFHDKFGLFRDNQNNLLYFRGSNNETEAAILYNYESFEVTCSWDSSVREEVKIQNALEKFNRLWENNEPNLVVLEIEDIIKKKILTYNKNKIILNYDLLHNDCLYLDYVDENMICEDMRSKNKNNLQTNTYFRVYVKPFIDGIRDDKYIIKKNGYVYYKKVIEKFETLAKKMDIKLERSERLDMYITERELYLKEKIRFGRDIKSKYENVLEKYKSYEQIVNNLMVRKLRTQQMWDSFFMCSMQRASNFSVPGSGKTSSVLGMYAYLKSVNEIDKIVVIGPKNSFKSWVDEFQFCFGDKETLKKFIIDEFEKPSEFEIKSRIQYNHSNYNMMLFNYDRLDRLSNAIKNAVNRKTLLIFDEVHKVKGEKSSRAKKAIDLALNSKYCLTLTGTPIPNGFQDIFNNLNLLYKDEYSSVFGYTINELKNASTMIKGSSVSTLMAKEISDKIYPFFCRTNKVQLGIPNPNEDIIIESYGSEDEKIIYQYIQNKYKKSFFVEFMRILQLESNPKLLLRKLDVDESLSDILDIDDIEIGKEFLEGFSDENIVEIINRINMTNKTKAVLGKVQQLACEGKPLIIWCIFTENIEYLAKEINSIGFSAKCIYGKTMMLERNQIIEDFKEKKINVLITNPHTLAESVSLHKSCHDAIYYEYSYNLVHLLQSKDRIHRLGLPENSYTQYYFSINKYNDYTSSLDAEVYKRLKNKEKMMLEAIDRGVLEPGYTPEEDLAKIFENIKLK